MAVRFKFRSSVHFDSVDIEGRPSISVRDLRSKIVAHKNLKICQDFDLVISDSHTGEEYDDENFLVPSGSSVILKRVPAGSAPSALPHFDSVEKFGIKHSNVIDTIRSSPSANLDIDNFDDFGIDLCPVPDAALSDSDPEVDKMNCIISEKAENAVPRCTKPPILRYQNLEPSDLSEAIPRGSIHYGIEGNTLQTKLKSKMEAHKKLHEVVNASPPAMQTFDLPSELRCPLCNMIFNDAVMIPCCQHSFCDKCIRLVLVEKTRCPKCSSTKCRLEDLLPNVSLRQAIEHFLESQILISASDDFLPKYAPDGESGIHVKDISCALSVLQREPELPHSPSTTGKGSNQVMTESAYESLIRNNTSTGGTGSRIIHLGAGKSWQLAPLSPNIQQINGELDGATRPVNFKSGPESLKSVADFQGESQSLKLQQTLMQNEGATSTSKKKKGLWVETAGGDKSFTGTSRHRKGDRTCYMCGSPDHFIRDCPAASSSYPMLQTGDTVFPGSMPAYGPPYWHGAPLTPLRPLANIYGTPGMMPFDTRMIPVTPFAVPSYMQSMYGGFPVPCGLRMGGLAPPMLTGAERPLSYAEFMELQNSQHRSKLLNEHQQREQSPNGDDLDECYRCNEPERRSQYCKPRLDRENCERYSEDTDIHRLRRKRPRDKQPDEGIHSVDWRHDKGCHSAVAGRDQGPDHSERSGSEVEDMSESSYRHCKERHKHYQRSSMKHSERRGQCGSDSSRRSHHGAPKETDSKRKMADYDAKRQSRKHHSHSESSLEPRSSGDRKRQRKEKELCHSSRHSRHKVKSTDYLLSYDRWEMVDGLDEDHREDYHHHHHKRKRIH
ncbi:hypothetical protein HHK36_014373 [Tetracentron sinense]|uniref:Uncharacterized protein n=1 Tax=Tetracentron sinense TaxID=13715 RepID=A0A834Z807_TETSI|nr:hypothetical protein HHK36_014373 [Tetracentron sinense]